MYEVASIIVLTIVPWQMLIILGLGVALIPIGLFSSMPGYALTNANSAFAPFIGVPIQFCSACLTITGFFLFIYEATKLLGVLVLL